MKEMIGYCGLDCEKCDAYIAAINDDQALREKTRKLWAELNNAPILPEHITVRGVVRTGQKRYFVNICVKSENVLWEKVFLLAATVLN